MGWLHAVNRPLPANLHEADEKDFVALGQARVLRFAIPVLSLLALAGVWMISAQPGTSPWEMLLYAVGSLCIALVGLQFQRGRLSYAAASVLVLSTIAGLLLERIFQLFLGGYFDDPQRSFFMPVFASLPLLYLMSFVLLPPRVAERLVIAMWLPITLLITALTMPYWGDTARRGSLVGLLSSVWLSHGIYLILFSAVGRSQKALVDRYAQLADSARRARDEVSQSEAAFRSIFDLAAVGINVTDEAGRYLMVNERMVDMLGYSREELLEENFRAVTLEADVAESDRLTADVAAGTRSQFRQDKRYLRKDGSVVHAEIFVRELERVAGGQRRFICVALDVTERRRAEARAAEYRRIRDFHFDHTPLAVVEFAPDLSIRRWSPRAEKIFGWTEAEALGRTAESLGIFSPEQVALRAERTSRMFRGEQDHLSAVVPMLHRSGRKLWIEIYNSVIRDAAGEVMTLVSMGLDVTESQEMLSMLNESEARFRGIFNQAAVGIALLDARGRWINVNQRLCEILGYPMDELLSTSFASITHPDDLQRDLHLSRALLDGSLDQFSIEKRYVHREGRIIWATLFVRRVDASPGEPPRFVSVVEDISERKAAEERVRALTAGLESQVVERTEQLHNVVRAGQRRNEELALITDMGRLLSASTDQVEATQVVMRYLPRVFPLADGALYLEGRRGGLFERQVDWGGATPGAQSFTIADCWALRGGEIHHVEGAHDPLHCLHVAAESHAHSHVCVPVMSLGQPLGVIELSWGRSDDEWAPEMTLVKTVAETIGLAFGNLRLREELSRQALMDPLTGLHNRRWLDHCLRERVNVHGRTGEGFAVLMIDVDHFKSINDSYGHEGGDRALFEVAQALQRAVRDHESAARFGGEEFTVILPATARVDAARVGERLRQAVAALQVRSNGADLRPVTISVGIAMFPEDGHSAQSVLEAADAALYQAKQSGRNRVCLADPAKIAALN